MFLLERLFPLAPAVSCLRGSSCPGKSSCSSFSSSFVLEKYEIFSNYTGRVLNLSMCGKFVRTYHSKLIFKGSNYLKM